METLNALTQCEIIDMSWFSCCWTVIVEDLPIDQPGKPAWGQEGGFCDTSGYVHSFPLGRWHSTMAYCNILVSWSPGQGTVRTWCSLTSLIVGLLCETVYIWGRGLDTYIIWQSSQPVQWGQDSPWEFLIFLLLLLLADLFTRHFCLHSDVQSPTASEHVPFVHIRNSSFSFIQISAFITTLVRDK